MAGAGEQGCFVLFWEPGGSQCEATSDGWVATYRPAVLRLMRREDKLGTSETTVLVSCSPMLTTGGGLRPQTLRWHLMPGRACVGQVPPARQGNLPRTEGLPLGRITSYLLVSLILSL